MEKERTTVYLPIELRKELDRIKNEKRKRSPHNITFTWVLLEAVKEYVERNPSAV